MSFVRRYRWLFIVVPAIATSLALGSWSYRATQASRAYTASYVGRGSCAKCHAAEVHKWTGSHHDLAMDPATEETVVDLKAFADQEFTHQGVTSKFFRKDGKFYITTDDESGKLATFEIKYVFGVDPLQQYMVEFADKKPAVTPQGEPIELPAGRVQVLSIAWDTHKGRWFHLYPNRKIPAGDWLHWTGGGQNWNYMCAECHSTDLQKKFNVAANAYHTSFAEIDVSCEACHGPASEHVSRAEGLLGFGDPRHFHSYALNQLKGPSSLGEIETCAVPRQAAHCSRRLSAGGELPRLLRTGENRRRFVLRRRSNQGRALRVRLLLAEPHVSRGSALLELP
ncbi:MAG: multiheme c-type cytochrome [Pirellulales bacterium]